MSSLKHIWFCIHIKDVYSPTSLSLLNDGSVDPE
nr:MAG TPA: hypothetical protein [Caudoviricetes sp.]